MSKAFVLRLIALLVLGASVASALTYSMGRLRDLPVGQSGYVGTWFLWADDPKFLCLNADGEVISERTSWAMMLVERRSQGYWVRLPEHFMLEIGDDTFQNKERGECLKVAGFLD